MDFSYDSDGLLMQKMLETTNMLIESSSSSSSSSFSSSSTDNDEIEEAATALTASLKVYEASMQEQLRCMDFPGEHGGSKMGRKYKRRRYEAALETLNHDYFDPGCVQEDYDFRRRFRMSRRLFLRILNAIGESSPNWRQKVDAVGKIGIHPKLKMTAALRCLSEGTSADIQDDYCKLGGSTANQALKQFCEAILNTFGEEYLRPPTETDIQRILEESARRGFPGCLGSIDCTHWVWKNCPSTWRGRHVGHHKVPTLVLEAVATKDLWIWHSFFGMPGSCNDINVLDRSPIFNDLINGRMPTVNFQVNNKPYHMGYYLADGIYPKWATLMQTISVPRGAKEKYFVQKQESARKDIERAFGVLKARWHILMYPARCWNLEDLGSIMRACIVLHNMIVEDERGDNVRQYIPDSGPIDHDAHLRDDAAAIFSRLTTRYSLLCSKTIHSNLKKDLIEHLWTRKGNLPDDADDN